MKAPELYQADIEHYCDLRHIELAETFSDIDFSAFRGAKTRPALEALKTRRKEFSAVIVPRLSRFGRSVKDLIGLFELFETDGVALIFLDMGLDTSTSQGRLLRHIMSAFAEYESDVRGDYFRAARDARLQKGLPPMGWVAYGYRRSNGTFEDVHQEAEVLQSIFRRYADGASMTGIARALNERGLPSPRGVRWGKPTVRKMLDNPHYAGYLLRDGQRVRGAWDPLISDELWATVERRRLSIANRGICVRRGIYLLSGMITCGVCGARLTHRTKQDRVPGQYVCRGLENLGSCRGGGIADHRAEALITAAYLARYGTSLVTDTSSSIAPVPARVLWDRSNLEGRRAMLRSAIARIILIPRPDDNRRGKEMPRGRELSIEWSVVEADPDRRRVQRSETMKAYFKEWGEVQRRMGAQQ
jgi:DNA invertase Pin-like site-specific DNA recombinase